MLKKLPKFVYVAIREPGEDEYLDCNVEPIHAIEDDGPTKVGTYQLVEVNQLSKRVVSKKSRP